MSTDESELLFADGEASVVHDHGGGAEKPAEQNWKVLIVDDEAEIHSVTKLAMRHFKFERRGLEFLDAYSGREAKNLIEQNPDTALVLLDVVMESDDAGLDVARHIREELHNQLVRIVLRTGQPGAAPEKDVIVNYEINEYKAKVELTAQKLFTTFVATLRNYRDLIALNENRVGLEKIVEASASLFETYSLKLFISGMLTQLTALLHLERDSLFCQTTCFASSELSGELTVLAGTGAWAQLANQPVASALPDKVCRDLVAANRKKCSLYFDDRCVLFLPGKDGKNSMVYFEGVDVLTRADKHLLEVFCANAAIAIDNLRMNKEIEDTQKEIIYRMGTVSETHSRETGNHIHRVAEYSGLLAQLSGLDEREVELIKLASSMHDIGKVGISDRILNKPGKLDPDEWELMRSHAVLGHEMLKGSRRPILQAAAIIALQHHERWDGTGYPHGLAGEDIHVYGRITALADVFDALGSDRVYKKAWPLEQILDYLNAEKGRQFDPRLIDLLGGNLAAFLAIRDSFKDLVA